MVIQNREILAIDQLDSIPPELTTRLAAFRATFMSHRFVEDLLRAGELAALAAELEEHLRSRWVRVWHCTKEPSVGHFQAQGLRVTDVGQHQADFVVKFGSLFTAGELAEMKEAWHGYFTDAGQARLRNGQLWGCLTRDLILEDRGVGFFFSLYGGEAISMPFDNHPTITPKLESIGNPVVVEVAVQGSALRATYPMSTALLSRYHRTVRQDAHVFESQAMWRTPVLPEDVLAVIPLKDFMAQKPPTK